MLKAEKETKNMKNGENIKQEKYPILIIKSQDMSESAKQMHYA